MCRCVSAARGSVASGTMQSVTTSRPRAVECACVRCVCVCAPLPRVDCGRVCVAHESVRKHRDPPAALRLTAHEHFSNDAAVVFGTRPAIAVPGALRSGRAKAPTSAWCGLHMLKAQAPRTHLQPGSVVGRARVHVGWNVVIASGWRRRRSGLVRSAPDVTVSGLRRGKEHTLGPHTRRLRCL
jgi:hypothetical protein